MAQSDRRKVGWAPAVVRSRRVLVTALIAVALVFTSATGYLGLRMFDEKGTVMALYRSGAWLTVQVQTEHLRLSSLLNRYQAEPTEANRQAVFERFDIFWSRFPLVLASDRGRGLQSIADMMRPIQDVFEDLPNLEADLAALDPARPESFGPARARLDSYADPIQELSLRVLHRDYFSASNRHLLDLQREAVFTYMVMLAAAGLLILLLWQQNRLAGRLTTEAERARETAERAERRLHVALDSVSDGFLLLDADLRVVLVNERFYELLPPELRGFKVGDDYRSVIRASANLGHYGRDVPPATAAKRRLSELMHPDAPIELTNPDGTQIRIQEYVTADGGRVSLRSDITSLRRAEREQLELQAQFYRAQKTEALGRLAGGVAHDFNNVLMSIQGYANFLREDLAPGSSERVYAEKILSDSQRAAALVAQLLDFGRHGGGLRQPVRLDEVAQETVELLSASLPGNLRARFRNDAPGALVHADAAQIAQVLMNLSVNARDAVAESGGRIELALRTQSTDGSWAARLAESDRLTAGAVVPTTVEAGADGRNRLWAGQLPPARYHVLEVIDDGAGMDLATLERIFDPFFTTKPLEQGSGLGLAAVHGIVLAHGGALAVETSPGGGTRMSVFLPAWVSDARREADGRAVETPDNRAGGGVLVVDEDPEAAEMAAVCLRRLGTPDVEVVGSMGEALERLKHRPDVDLVLSEGSPASHDKDDPVALLHRHRPDLPVILMVASTESLEGVRAQDCGAVALLRKPLEPAALREAVRQALEARGPEERSAMPHRVA